MDSELTNVFTEMVGAVKHTIDLYGEQAVDLSLLVVQLESIKKLSWIIPFIIVTFVACRYIKPSIDTFRENCDEYAGPNFEDVLKCGIVAVASIVGMIGTLINMKNLFDPVLWASAIGYPEVEVARMIINTTIGN